MTTAASIKVLNDSDCPIRAEYPKMQDAYFRDNGTVGAKEPNQDEERFIGRAHLEPGGGMVILYVQGKRS